MHTVWLCRETSNNKHDRNPVKYMNVFHNNRTQKKLKSVEKHQLGVKATKLLFNYCIAVFRWKMYIYVYILKIVGTLDMSGHFHQKQ